jgi:predicted phosphodiesterase
LQPDLVVWLGDYLDLASFSHFDQEPAFAQTTQHAIDYGHQLLAQVRATSPDSKVVVMEGNHDRRLQKMVTRNAMEAFGLRRANEVTGWPVLSVPFLLRFEDLGIDYVGAYPAGSYWINERLKCVHGSIVRSGGSTALAVVAEERVSTIFGHIHRIETQYRTADVHSGGSARVAHTCGCLCRIDGAVPSVKGSTDLTGRPVIHYENWQHGLSVVSFREGDSPFNLESVYIGTFDGYITSFGGRLYRPR